MSKQLIKINWDFESYQPYNKNSKINIEGDCADICFVNNTDGVVSVNNYPINSGGSLALNANDNEITVSKFQLVNSTATTGNVNVIRKRYVG